MKNKWLVVLSALLLSAAGALGQIQGAPGNPYQQSLLHRVGGAFYAAGYNTWQANVISGNTTTGAGVSVIIYSGPAGVETLADGSTLPLTTVYNTNVPIIVDYGQANQETVTPTSVSVSGCPGGNLGVGGAAQCVTVTSTFNNTHGQSAIVVSGDFGIFEAITDAGNQGGGTVFWMVDTGIVTLSTVGLTTTTTTKVPTTFINVGASARVTTTITTSTNWAVGIAGTTSAFCTANATLTAGTTCIANQVSPVSVGTTNVLTPLLITVTGANAGAGAVKVRVWGYTAVQASS